MKYYLVINSLINCPFSIEVENILKTTTIEHKINKITVNEKHLYKNDTINTFPQIFFKKHTSKGSLLLGGNTDFKEIIQLKNKKLQVQIDTLTKKYPLFSKKIILRLIEFFN